MDIPKHLIFNCPFKEVQLSERGLNIRSAVFMRDIDSVPSTKWVEPFLGIGAEFQLVIYIDFEPFCRRAAVFKFIHRVMFLGIIRYKPVHNTQGNIRRAIDDSEHLLHVFAAVFIVEPEDFMKKEVVLGVI